MVGKCFGNHDMYTNGESLFYANIKDNIEVIFDVGSSDETLFTDFLGEVHYFEPSSRIENLEKQPTKNKKSVFNNFGLSDETSKLREITWETAGNVPGSDILHPPGSITTMRTLTGSDYLTQNKISNVDFIKIDTEGHELQILQGFGNYLKNTKIIQFEYGGTTYACGIKLIEIIELLQQFNFKNFSYISPDGLEPFKWDRNKEDHYTFCNIVCFNEYEYR
tara:strand:+ start:2549 stop:3211 length:663 start_codon:yes stop_codon:yes gene_type:complete